MKERYKSLPRAQKIASLEQALNYIAEMVQTREDGDLYIGQFEMLEAELAAVKAKDNVMLRIQERHAVSNLTTAS